MSSRKLITAFGYIFNAKTEDDEPTVIRAIKSEFVDDDEETLSASEREDDFTDDDEETSSEEEEETLASIKKEENIKDDKKEILAAPENDIEKKTDDEESSDEEWVRVEDFSKEGISFVKDTKLFVEDNKKKGENRDCVPTIDKQNKNEQNGERKTVSFTAIPKSYPKEKIVVVKKIQPSSLFWKFFGGKPADIADESTENVTELATESAESVNTIENDSGNNATEVDGEAEESEYGISQLERRIINQMEYYFSDANLSRDRFLVEQIMKDNEYWVPLSVLVTFKRLAALSTDIGVIANALLKSQKGLLEVSKDRTKIRHNPKRPILDPIILKEMITRTVYVKGFPLNADIDELLEFFAPHEKVISITIRKYFNTNENKHLFKGSVFAIFEKKEQAQKFIEADEIIYKGNLIIRKWKDAYSTAKREAREAARECERARREKEDLERKAKQADKMTIELPKNTVLHFESVEGDIRREEIREAINTIDPELKIGFIECHLGDNEGYIRFQEEGNADKFLEKLTDRKLKVNDDVELTIRKLGEEEEIEFLAKVVRAMVKIRERRKKRNKGGRRRHYGGFNNKKETTSGL